MVTETDTLPLIRAKLYRPPITGDLVPRPRLLDRLLALVVAPAGYGKNTLVTNWLATCDWPNAWLSLDEEDDYLVVLNGDALAVNPMEIAQAQVVMAVFDGQVVYER